MLYKDEIVVYKGKKLKCTYYTGGIEQELDLSGFNGREVIEEIKKLEAEGVSLESMYCTSISRYGDDSAVIKYTREVSSEEIENRKQNAITRAKTLYDRQLEDAKKLLKEAGECNVS